MISYSLLEHIYGARSGPELLEPLIKRDFKGRIALVSSFGAEAAVLAHMVSEIDKATPVIFVDTGKLFPETLAYRDELIAKLGLSDVRTVSPLPADEQALDKDGRLNERDPDTCCNFRKVEPMERALRGFNAWISGRKRYQSDTRAAIPVLETQDWRLKVNPLATWTPADVAGYFKTHDLPAHPLVARGYPSIGCVPCTSKVAPGEDLRAGRWRGLDKSECGIHFAHNGRPIRVA